MKFFVPELKARLDSALAGAGQEPDPLRRYDLSIMEAKKAVDELKAYLQANPFSGEEEEIHYFKDLAPVVYGKLFYFQKVHKMEVFRQYSSPSTLRKIFKRELKEIKAFSFHKSDFCQYYHSQATHFDKYYFTREGRQASASDEIGAVIEPNFCLGSFWVAWIIANGFYRAWLKDELDIIKNPVPAVGNNGKKKHNIRWKAAKIDLVEVLYGLFLADAIGDDSGELKPVFEWIEDELDIDLGHYYNTFQEIARRKKTRTKFLDFTKERLEKRMDDML